MEKDGGSLRVGGRVGLYDCIATKYCVHKIKGLKTSLRMGPSKSYWKQRGRMWCHECMTARKTHKSSFNPSWATLSLHCKTSWKMATFGFKVWFIRLLREPTAKWNSRIGDYWNELNWLNVAWSKHSAELPLSFWCCITLQHNCRSFKTPVSASSFHSS